MEGQEPIINPGAGAPPAAGGTEQMIPYSRFQEVNTRAQAAEAKVIELTKQLEGIKGKDERIAALEKELKETKDGYELERTNTRRKAAIEAAIKDKVVDPEVVMKLLDLEKVAFDDKGQVTGLDDQLEAMKSSKPYLWKPARPVVKPGAGEPSRTGKSFAQKLAEEKNARQGVVAKSKNYF